MNSKFETTDCAFPFIYTREDVVAYLNLLFLQPHLESNLRQKKHVLKEFYTAQVQAPDTRVFNFNIPARYVYLRYRGGGAQGIVA